MRKKLSRTNALFGLLGVLTSLAGCGSEGGDLASESTPPSIDQPSLGAQDICVDCENGGGGGNPGALPDVRPVFITTCPRNSSWELIVRVKNVGTAPAPASITRVTWYYGGSVDWMPYSDIVTGPLNPGQTLTYYRPIPASCFDPECSFAVTTDLNHEVNESNETNNTHTGLCQR